MNSKWLNYFLYKLSRFKNFILYKLFNIFIDQSIIKNQLLNLQTSRLTNKILFVIPTLGHGGSERQFVNHINWLISTDLKANKTKFIICLLRDKTSNDLFFGHELHKSIQIIILKKSIKTNYLKEILKNPELFWLGTNLKYISALNEIILREKPRIIHAWLDLPGILAGIVGLRNPTVKIIISTRSLNPTYFTFSKFYYRSALRRILKFPKLVLTNNSFAGAKSYEDWLGLQSGTIQVIPNGYNLNKFSIRKNSQNISQSSKFVIGGVMRLTWEKDIDLWLDIAKEITKKDFDVKFKIVGSGPNYYRVKSKIFFLGLSKYVELVPANLDIYSIMSGFDLLLSTSLIEGLPNVIIESQLLGVPVVATDVGGTSEAFIAEKSGYLLRSRNPNHISQVIIDLLSSSDLLKRFSDIAIKQASTKFNINKVSYQYWELYKHVH